MAGEVRVTVIVPARDAASAISRCLAGLAAQESAPSYDVVVVDDGSTDGTAETAAAHPLHPRIVRQPGRGSYAARNAGAAEARGAVLAFTDADCVPQPGWLAAGIRAIDQGCDLAGGPIVLDTPAKTAATAAADYDRGSYLQQER